jgi:hypothetical protein
MTIGFGWQELMRGIHQWCSGAGTVANSAVTAIDIGGYKACVGANLFAKAVFQAMKMRRMYRPFRE